MPTSRAGPDGSTDVVSHLPAWPPLAADHQSLHLAAGASLFLQGEDCRAIYLIERGIFKLTRQEARGRQVLVGLRPPGSILGAAEAVLQAPHILTATAAGQCDVCTVSLKDLSRLGAANPNSLVWLHQSHAQECLDYVAMIGLFGTATARDRLKVVLLEYAVVAGREMAGGSIRLDVSMTGQELAEAIGSTREHVSRILRDYERDGVIERNKGWVSLPRTSGLARQWRSRRGRVT